ncbi:MAG: hypothetical protein ACYCWW_17810 [Deltaproteobacteria bacterium]
MDIKVAALVAQYGIAPQDFEALADDSDLLAVTDGLLHDPDVCLEAADHLEEVLAKPVIWLPAHAPFGDLWREVRVGPEARPLKLCRRCYEKK